MASPMSQHASPSTFLIWCGEWSWARGPTSKWQGQCCDDKSNVSTCKSRNNINLILRMKLGRRPSFKMTSPMLQWQVHFQNMQIQKQVYFNIKNEAGPKTQLQRGKSNAQTSNSRNNSYYYSSSSLRMKLGGWPSAKMTVQCPSIQIQNHNLQWRMKLGRRPSFEMPTSMLWFASPETIVMCHSEWSWDEGSGAGAGIFMS